MRHIKETNMHWSEIIKRIEAGEKQAVIASDLGITLAQLRYRLRKFREQQQQHATREVAATGTTIQEVQEVQEKKPRDVGLQEMKQQNGNLQDENQQDEKVVSDIHPERSARATNDQVTATGIVSQIASQNAALLYDESWSRTWQSNRLMLLVKEPTTVFAYWEVDDLRKKLIGRHFQCDWSRLPFFLQLYDVTDIHFDGNHAHSTRQIPVFPDSDNWYIHHVEPCRRYLIDFGTTTIHGKFFTILRSNIVETPPLRSFRQQDSYVQFGQRYQSNQMEPTFLGHDKQAKKKKTHTSQVPSVPYEDAFDGYSVTGPRREDNSWNKGI
jgi:hypothetical protein